MVEDVSFDEAVADTTDVRRDLLLGNGFSIAAHRGFAYGTLYREAIIDDFRLADLFRRLDTTNFEVALQAAETVEERELLRDGLIKAVIAVHPRHSHLTSMALTQCGQFLRKFIAAELANRGKLFTTNYDLILYWVLMRNREVLNGLDGFDSEGVWSPNRNDNTFVYFVHGALHIRQRPLGVSGKKYATLKLMHEGGSLILQIRDHITRGEMPVFVSEGTAPEKQGRISQSEYLRRARRQFQRACREEQSALFIVGHGLGNTDQHLLDYIGFGRIPRVFVGYHSGADRGRIDDVAAKWAASRRLGELPPIQVKAFPTSECQIWSAA